MKESKEQASYGAIRVKDLDFSIDSKTLLEKVTLQIGKNEMVGLIGPNGSGKSTLLKNIYRQYKPSGGAVYITGDNIKGLKNKEIARRMAVVSQENQMTFDFTVREIVGLGRYAHCRFLQDSGKEDEKICQEALEAVGMEAFIDRSFLSLSGGEKQRVYVAMAFAQQSPILLLDEPTNHLDIGYQMLLMETMHKMRRERNLTIFTSVHDMNLAAWYCSRLIVLDHGKVVTEGSPQEILTPKLIRKVFHVNAAVTKREDGKLQIEYQSYCN